MSHAPGPGASTGEPFCNAPSHDEECNCGARPDWEFESRREEWER